MLAYEVYGLTKVYKGEVVANDNLTFDIRCGEIFGLLGPNGAGKTTLVRQLMGLSRPTSGQIKLFGELLTEHAIHRIPWYVSYIPQRLGAVSDLTAHEALRITGTLRGMDYGEASKQARSLIDEFRLAYLGRRRIGQMSGGEQRLVALCMGLMASRPVMILDEPTNDLDPSYRKQVWDKLREINQVHRTTIILVTHNVLEAEKVLQRVGIINEGRIQAMGTVGSLKARIDQRVRIDVRLKRGAGAYVSLGFLESMDGVEARALSDGDLVLLVPMASIQQVIDRVISNVGLTHLEDLRIVTPTVEDVYLQLGGGKRLDRGA
ncbi:MAG: ABC transporter ATP-binding protein [Firmicutes bacterium]|nr:ABC transporter ATP-binding protein [Candidatus Fermentithermobacillaceae bacterium]